MHTHALQVWHIRQEDGKGNTKGVWSMDYVDG